MIETCCVCGRRDYTSRMTVVGYLRWAHFWHAKGGRSDLGLFQRKEEEVHPAVLLLWALTAALLAFFLGFLIGEFLRWIP